MYTLSYLDNALKEKHSYKPCLRSNYEFNMEDNKGGEKITDLLGRN